MTHISRGVVTRLGPSTRHCVNASKNTACMTVEKKKRRATPRELPVAYRVENGYGEKVFVVRERRRRRAAAVARHITTQLDVSLRGFFLHILCQMLITSLSSSMLTLPLLSLSALSSNSRISSAVGGSPPFKAVNNGASCSSPMVPLPFTSYSLKTDAMNSRSSFARFCHPVLSPLFKRRAAAARFRLSKVLTRTPWFSSRFVTIAIAAFDEGGGHVRCAPRVDSVALYCSC